MFAVMAYLAAADRDDSMTYRRCGRSGLDLPAVSLGRWQNFGDGSPLETQRAILRRARLGTPASRPTPPQRTGEAAVISVAQLADNVAAPAGPPLTDELEQVDRHAVDAGIDLWARSSAG